MNITTTSLKTALVLIALPLFLAGCVLVKNQNANINAVVNNANVSNTNNSNTGTTNTNASPTNTNTSNTNEQTSAIDTTDWQTYTNDEYGFSFRHPKEWTVEESNNILFVYNPGKISPIIYKDALTINITAKKFDEIKQNIESSDVVNGESLSKFDELPDTQVNGVISKTGTHWTAIGNSVKYYYIPLYKKKQAIYIEFDSPDGIRNVHVSAVIETLLVD